MSKKAAAKRVKPGALVVAKAQGEGKSKVAENYTCITKEALIAERRFKDDKPLMIAKLSDQLIKDWRYVMLGLGDCMKPTILNGAVVGYDIDDTKPLIGEIYLFQMKKLAPRFLIKRLKRVTTGVCVVLGTDNTNYKDLVVQEGDYEIVGRIRWVCNEGL